jgi:hypothetical protein
MSARTSAASKNPPLLFPVAQRLVVIRVAPFRINLPSTHHAANLLVDGLDPDNNSSWQRRHRVP